MTKERLDTIKENIAWRQQQAQEIMEGGENYDGADGARYMLALCKQAQELVVALEEKGTEL